MKETPKDTTSTTGTTASKAPSAKKGAVKKAPVKKKAAAKKTSVKKKATNKSETSIKAVFIKTNPGIKSFRRAGFGFNEAGYGIALDVLKKAQLKQLEEEPNLIVEHCTVSADEVKVK